MEDLKLSPARSDSSEGDGLVASPLEVGDVEAVEGNSSTSH